MCNIKTEDVPRVLREINLNLTIERDAQVRQECFILRDFLKRWQTKGKPSAYSLIYNKYKMTQSEIDKMINRLNK